MSAAEIRKQIEYYLGDLNLARDDFFRDVITKTEGGYVDITNFLNCNKVKKMNVNAEAIAAAVKDSTAVELSKDKKSVRRANNKALPEKTGNMKKREQKAAEKEEEKKEENNEPVQRDEQGRIIFLTPDFENPIIIHFKTEDQDADKDENFKVNWKDIENMVKEKFDKLKVVYSRADKYEGDIAISSHRVNMA